MGVTPPQPPFFASEIRGGARCGCSFGLSCCCISRKWGAGVYGRCPRVLGRLLRLGGMVWKEVREEGEMGWDGVRAVGGGSVSGAATADHLNTSGERERREAERSGKERGIVEKSEYAEPQASSLRRRFFFCSKPGTGREEMGGNG